MARPLQGRECNSCLSAIRSDRILYDTVGLGLEPEKP